MAGEYVEDVGDFFELLGGAVTESVVDGGGPDLGDAAGEMGGLADKEAAAVGGVGGGDDGARLT
ncbi:hypothetical protein [Streptomyces mirabilis]|uniref:hypothetical protein n=1 Tax=Streptomyces mirabilis TaxID=68239 RepID=UPI0036878965